MRIAISNGKPTIITPQVYSSQCCPCDLPCFNWDNNTIWPCCGLAQQYKVTFPDAYYRGNVGGSVYVVHITGDVLVTATYLKGVWSGRGGTATIGDPVMGAQPTGQARVQLSWDPGFSIINDNCFWRVNVQTINGPPINRVIPFTKSGPIGEYKPGAGFIGMIKVS